MQKNTNPEGLVCAVLVVGWQPSKKVGSQEVRAADNACGLMGSTAENQAVFVFLSVGLAQSIIEFSSGFTL